MRRRGLKPVVLVELPGALVKGMHENGSYASVLGHSHRAIDRVLEQGGAQMHSLCLATDREPGENHYRNRIRHISAHATRCDLVRNGAGCHGVVAADAAYLIGHHEGAAGAACLIGQCPALEPVIELDLATLKVL